MPKAVLQQRTEVGKATPSSQTWAIRKIGVLWSKSNKQYAHVHAPVPHVGSLRPALLVPKRHTKHENRHTHATRNESLPHTCHKAQITPAHMQQGANHSHTHATRNRSHPHTCNKAQTTPTHMQQGTNHSHTQSHLRCLGLNPVPKRSADGMSCKNYHASACACSLQDYCAFKPLVHTTHAHSSCQHPF